MLNFGSRLKGDPGPWPPPGSAPAYSPRPVAEDNMFINGHLRGWLSVLNHIQLHCLVSITDK